MDVAKRYIQFNDWFKTAHGKILEQSLYDLLIKNNFFNCSQLSLQLGRFGENKWLIENPKRILLLSPCYDDKADVIAKPTEIPLKNHSIQQIFAPFVLDLGVPIESFAFEVDRLLSSSGRLLIVGMNPTGLWRMSRFFVKKKQWYQFSSSCSYWCLSRYLKKIGFVMDDVQFYYYLPPVQNKKALRYFSWVNHFAKLIAPYPPAFYILIMHKYDPQMIGAIDLETAHLCQIR